MKYMFTIKIGIILCMLSVLLGAFGAHTLKDMIGEKMDVFKTGIQYQIFHSLALIILGILSKSFNLNLVSASYFMLAGILFFSGSLYLISIYKYTFLGIATPVGGICFVIGWCILLYKISF